MEKISLHLVRTSYSIRWHRLNLTCKIINNKVMQSMSCPIFFLFCIPVLILWNGLHSNCSKITCKKAFFDLLLPFLNKGQSLLFIFIFIDAFITFSPFRALPGVRNGHGSFPIWALKPKNLDWHWIDHKLIWYQINRNIHNDVIARSYIIFLPRQKSVIQCFDLKLF